MSDAPIIHPLHDLYAGTQSRLLCLKRYLEEHYDLEIHDFRLLASSMNDNYMVTTSDKKYLFRLVRADKDQVYTQRFGVQSHLPHILEQEMLAHLDKKGIICPYHIPRRDGAYYAKVPLDRGQDRTGILQLFLEGVHVAASKHRHIYLLGEELARWHLAGQDFESPLADRWTNNAVSLIDSALPTIRSYQNSDEDERYKWRPGEYRKILDRCMALSEELKEYEASIQGKAARQGINHGDCNSKNQLYDSATEPTKTVLIDTDLMRTGVYAYDLALFLIVCDENLGMSSLSYRSFISGYRRINTEFSQEDVDMISKYHKADLVNLTDLSIRYSSLDVHYDRSLPHFQDRVRELRVSLLRKRVRQLRRLLED